MNLTSCHNLAYSCVKGHIKERNGDDLDEPARESPELYRLEVLFVIFKKNVSLTFLIG